jgi:RecB family exonuclease
VADLYAFQRAIAQYACSGEIATIRSTVVLVSTHAAGAELRHTLENLLLLAPGANGGAVVVLPDILTRDGWYERLHRAFPGAPRLLTPVECEVLMARAARAAIEAGQVPPFRVRPALVAEMRAFFDTMVRLGRTLDAFERLMAEKLEPSAPIDRGAASLLEQTRFLVASFRRYRQLVAASDALDEHLLRERLFNGDGGAGCTRVVVTAGDRSCGTGGLWPVDFDLLARLPHLSEVDVLATENVLAAGLHERLQDALPGFDEVDFGQPAAIAGRVPALVTRAGEGSRYWVHRDREEELTAIARRTKSQARSDAAPTALDRTAVICKRPLPYVYLAQSCLGAAGIPFQAFDDLPLAAEPFAAAVDLVFRCVETGFTRRPAIALLRSPHFVFRDDRGEVPRDSTNALDEALRDAGGTTTPGLLARLVEQGNDPEAPPVARLAVRAASALVRVVGELAPLAQRQPASDQCDVLLAFLDAHAATADARSPLGMRTARARGAILGVLGQLRAAHRAYDDPRGDFASFASTMRRWMEAQTFSPRTGEGGLHLLDADAARYGDFDDAYLVGAIERDWPDNPGRTVFYPLTLLNQLGWPPERLRLDAARAAFRDLVRLSGRRVWVSTFVLEDDAIVEPSPLLDELDRLGLAVSACDPPPPARMLPEEALSLDPVRPEVLAAPAREWATLRQRRASFDEPGFHGCTGPLVFHRHAVRRLETYLDCPFKYFAQTVLRLPDESDDDPRDGPRAQGTFLHDLLRAFFDQWQASGGGSITGENIGMARSLLVALVDSRLTRLPRAEGETWRARLLGSPARAGIGEAVFRAEAVAGGEVVDRLLEVRLDGSCHLEAGAASRDVTLHGIADRVDVLEGDRLRLVDYKLGRTPDIRRAVQLPVYAVQVCQQLLAAGRAPVVIDAAYLAFGEREPFVPIASRGTTLDAAIGDGQRRAVRAIEGIEAGAFPPRPADAFQCGYCPYATVCRKDYVDGE